MLRPTAPDFVVDPPSVDFGELRLTTRHTVMVNVTNRGKTRVDVSAAVDGPFESASSFSLAPGEGLPLAIAFIPTDVGPARGSLTLTAETVTHVVTLVGAAIAPEVCTTPLPCWSATVVEGLCHTEKQPDGTMCTDSCLDNARCQNGVCVGAAKQCVDDGNLCTVESCQTMGGCRAVPRMCAAPSSPCRAARCDPQLGCLDEPVMDGTACGPATCTQALVCLRGDCVPRPVADGAPCNTGMVCHSAGHCMAGACAGSVESEPQPITTRMNTWPLGASDGLGTQFAIVGFDAGAMVAAYESDGGTRFTTVLPSWPAMTELDSNFVETYPLQSALTADTLIVGATPFASATSGPAVVSAVDATSGAVRWSRVIDNALVAQCGQANTTLTHVAIDGAGQLLISVSRHSCSQFSVIAMNVLTGAVLWSFAGVGARHGLVGAAAGGAWVSDGTNLIHLNQQGQSDRLQAMRGVVNAVNDGVIWFRERELIGWQSLDGGTLVRRTLPFTPIYDFTRDAWQPWVSGESVKAVIPMENDAGFQAGWGIDDGRTRTLFSTEAHLLSAAWGYALVDGRSAIVTASTRNVGLFVIGRDAGVDEACSLGELTTQLRSSPVLSAGRIVGGGLGRSVTLDLPGIVPAVTSTWSQPLRDAQRSNRDAP